MNNVQPRTRRLTTSQRTKQNINTPKPPTSDQDHRRESQIRRECSAARQNWLKRTIGSECVRGSSRLQLGTMALR
ncbi:hypothetical protein EYF80_049538 [Liparis tanakae]|uniref:Uncharacterized protein n=1 Tax=Liparis tanakae TaxID=230148 RepID=A0A4Z2FHA3_9TELE|nr:hypothetical protein EYF80_049538 [Liparis tanakae]